MAKGRILVVDDDHLIRYGLTFAFKALGFEVGEASNAEEALREMHRQPYDMCFLDWQLPGLDGLSALRCIKAIWPSLKVVFMTAREPDREQQRMIRRLADQYMEKPFELDFAKELASAMGCPADRTPE